MKNLKNSAKLLACVGFIHCGLFGMDLLSNSPEFKSYITSLIKIKLGPQVRAYMYASPEDNDVQMLNRYIDIVFDNYIQLQVQGQLVKIENLLDLLSKRALCTANLQKIFNVSTRKELDMRLGAMGILYDSYDPCATWNQCFLIIQNRLFRKMQLTYNPT